MDNRESPNPAASTMAWRSGPRPLGFHLSAAMTILLGSLAALPAAKRGSLAWSPRLARAAARLQPALAAAPNEALTAAVAAEASRRLHDMLSGIERYRAHPYRRALTPPPVVHADGATRVLAYGGRRSDPIVLFIPSLINRSYILDLSEKRSLMRFLAQNGIRPWLVDWGELGDRESQFDISDYVIGRLGAILEFAVNEAKKKVAVVGYCMGGNLALAAALTRPDTVSAVGLLATPWDFAVQPAPAASLLGAIGRQLAAILAEGTPLPIDALQILFLALDPLLTLRKFADFAALDPAGAEAEHFVAVEDWVNDGVPLAGRVAAECLIGWYGENRPHRGTWQIGGKPIQPRHLPQPAFVAIPAADRIVPPHSAKALAAAIPEVTVVTPSSGHIGMVVGSQAENDLWRPLATWLRDLAD